MASVWKLFFVLDVFFGSLWSHVLTKDLWDHERLLALSSTLALNLKLSTGGKARVMPHRWDMRRILPSELDNLGSGFLTTILTLFYKSV